MHDKYDSLTSQSEDKAVEKSKDTDSSFRILSTDINECFTNGVFTLSKCCTYKYGFVTPILLKDYGTQKIAVGQMFVFAFEHDGYFQFEFAGNTYSIDNRAPIRANRHSARMSKNGSEWDGTFDDKLYVTRMIDSRGLVIEFKSK